MSSIIGLFELLIFFAIVVAIFAGFTYRPAVSITALRIPFRTARKISSRIG